MIDASHAERLTERVFHAALGAGDIAILYLGQTLGLFRAMAAVADVTAPQLAAATGTSPRYCREWLEAAAATGIIDVADASAEPDARRFFLPVGAEGVLADEDDPGYLGFVSQVFAGSFNVLPALVEAFRTGGGVPWSSFGPEVIEGQEIQNKTLFLSKLGTEWLPGLPDVDARLRAGGARVADIACGTGWSSIAIAESYPAAVVDGFDLDAYSIDKARGYASQRGLSDRVRFEVRDATDPALSGTYDLVTIFEALHDMGDPVAALRAAKSLAGDRGTVIIVDEKTEETFTPNAPDLERLFYAFSLLLCLPSALADGPVGTGTVMRPDTVRRYATEAGFEFVEILPIETDMFRFYRLR